MFSKKCIAFLYFLFFATAFAEVCKECWVGSTSAELCKDIKEPIPGNIACEKDYSPVCMSNGKDYSNKCMMCAALGLTKITLTKCGKCEEC